MVVYKVPNRKTMTLLSVFLASGIAVQPSISEDIVVKATGAYATIDTKLATSMIGQLTSDSADQRDKAIQDIEESSDKYPPPVFYVLSSVLFEEGKKDDAEFWFYAGQLRGRYDANRCADVSARSAIGALNQQFGSQINQYAFTDLPKLEALIPKVIEWDRKTPHNYDQRWINLHGMDSMITSLDGTKKDKVEMSLPKSQWESIAEKTRTDYLTGFNQALVELKQKAPPIQDSNP